MKRDGGVPAQKKDTTMNTDDFWDGAHQPGGDINQSVDTARFVQPNPDNSKEETKKTK